MMRCVYKTLVLIACDYLSIMKISVEGHKTSTYACMTLWPIVKRKKSLILNRGNSEKCVFDGFSLFVATELTFQKFHSSQCHGGPPAMFSVVDFSAIFTCIMPD